MLDVVGRLYAFKEAHKLLSLIKWPLYVAKGPKRPSIPVVLHIELERIANEVKQIVEDSSRLITLKWTVEASQGWELRGPIRWDLSIKALSRLEPPIYVEIQKAPGVEYLVLKRLLEFIVLTSSYVLESIRQIETLFKSPICIPWINIVRDKLIKLNDLCHKWLSKYPLSIISTRPVKHHEEALKSLRDLMAISESTIRPWRPKWVERLKHIVNDVLELWNWLKGLVDIVEHAHIKPRDLKIAFRYLAWRLYELYILLITLNALDALCQKHSIKCEFEIRKPRGCISREGIIVRMNGEMIEICIGVVISSDMMLNAQINPPLLDAKRLAGRPDISLMKDSKRVIIEAKFTDSIGYLTTSRFKLIAYLFECNAEIGILTFPWPPIRRGYEAEERMTYVLAKAAYEKGPIEVILNGRKLYYVAIEPKRELFDDNVKKMAYALEFLFK